MLIKNDMEIKSTMTNHAGQTFSVVYRDADSLAELGDRKVSSVHALCFYKGKMLAVFSEAKGYWTPPGGGVEAGETIEEAVVREVWEETNMRVVSQRLIGYQDVFEPTRVVTQTRHFCIVEPIGKFEKDPDGDVTEIKLIDPKEYKKYFDWGKVGERIVERAVGFLRGIGTGK